MLILVGTDRAIGAGAADALNTLERSAPEIWKVEITPQMKETITAKGQALFGAVAPQQTEPVQDEHDVVAAPLSPQGYLSRFLTMLSGRKEEGTYKAEGWFSAGGRFNDKIQEALRTKIHNGRALSVSAAFYENEYRKALKEIYGKAGPSKADQRLINLALGNVDNRLTPVQAREAKMIRDPKLRAQFHRSRASGQCLCL